MIMKRLLLITSSMLIGALGAVAAIVEGYNAPTELQAFYTDGAVTLWFKAPANGGVVWRSDFSYENGLCGMQQLGDGDVWTNAGNGQEISTSAAVGAVFTNHASTLALPVLSLTGGANYELSFWSAGSRKTSNQQLQVVLYHDGEALKTVVEAFELAPSLGYEEKTATFSVEADGEYEVRFEFVASEKTCGASLMNVVLTSPVPEGRGALTGYNLYRNGEQTRTYAVEEAVENQLFMELVDDSSVEYSTEYAYQLQAVYEGGESPLSATATITTSADPMESIGSVVISDKSKMQYDLSGRKADHRSTIKVENGRKRLSFKK